MDWVYGRKATRSPCFLGRIARFPGTRPNPVNRKVRKRRSGRVSRILSAACAAWRSCIWADGRPPALAPYPQLGNPEWRIANSELDETGRLSLLIWACWRWGLPCHDRHRPRGALLPHHFTLTGGNVENLQTECDRCNRACAIRRIKRSRRIRSGRCFRLGGVFSVALSLGSRRVGVTNHRALPSPDFPPANHIVCGRSPSPASSFTQTPIRLGPALRDSHAGGSSSRSKRHD